jgi:hypothetical protein
MNTFSKHYCLQCHCDIHATCILDLCKFPSAEQTSILQVVLESSNDHANGNVECCGTDASREAMVDDSNMICFMVQARHIILCTIHSQVASQGTGVVHSADMAIHQCYKEMGRTSIKNATSNASVAIC